MTYQSKHTKIYDAKTGYDKVGDQYRNYHDHLNSFDKGYFLNLLPKDTSNLDIIDLGAGDGRLYKLFESRGYKFNSYTAIDISPKLLKNHPDQVNKIIGNLEDDLTFENESFDFAFSFFVFEHLSDLNNLFSETERILRTGGQFIIGHFIQRREFLRKSDPNKNGVQSENFKIQFFNHRLQDIEKVAKKNLLSFHAIPMTEKGHIIGHIIICNK